MSSDFTRDHPYPSEYGSRIIPYICGARTLDKQNRLWICDREPMHMGDHLANECISREEEHWWKK